MAERESADAQTTSVDGSRMVSRRTPQRHPQFCNARFCERSRARRNHAADRNDDQSDRFEWRNSRPT
jgi:hypothetical protein